MAGKRQFLTFWVGELFYGVEVSAVQEVIRDQKMTRVPLGPAAVSGLINLRGNIVTALDLRHRLQLPPRVAGQLPMNVVIRDESGSVSLQVDRIGDVVEVEEQLFDPAAEQLAGKVREPIVGVCKLDGCLLHVLDVARVSDLFETGAVNISN